MSNNPSFPVGAVVAFAGYFNANTNNGGWYLCNGAGVDPDKVPSLRDVIGNYYGGSSDGRFYVPDYRGQFLRGADAGAGRDPDVAARMQPRSELDNNGAFGSSVGSRQASAMNGEHNHNYNILTTETEGRRTSPSSKKLDVLLGTPEKTTASGASGCAELRPVNQYVNFIIRSEVPAAGSGAGLQPGIVVAYAGDLSSQSSRDAIGRSGWMLCDGRIHAAADPTYAPLYDAISTNYGADYPQNFCLPCYFGRFLRGVSTGEGTDPDYNKRKAPRPDLTNNPGNSGGVGSVQDDAFPAHTHDYTVSGESDDDKDGAIDTHLALRDTDTVDTSGGSLLGTESRPKNVALEYLIFYPSKGGAIPPGTVVPYAGDANNPNAHFDPSDEQFCGWLACDGRAYGSASFPELFEAVGHAHGGSGASFNVPDLRGRFVRGVDYSAEYGFDPLDNDPRQATAGGGNATGVGSCQEDSLGYHTHSVSPPNRSAELESGNDDRTDGRAMSMHTTSGATLVSPASSASLPLRPTLSSENRPTNMYVHYLIKT